jgi:hypothetical protein
MLQKVANVAGQISIIVVAIIVAMLILEWREKKREAANSGDRGGDATLSAPGESSATK